MPGFDLTIDFKGIASIFEYLKLKLFSWQYLFASSKLLEVGVQN
jgi:hypothetical protein